MAVLNFVFTYVSLLAPPAGLSFASISRHIILIAFLFSHSYPSKILRSRAESRASLAGKIRVERGLIG